MSLVISKVFTYDTDAGNYIQAVEAADTVALEPAVRQAINNFVIGCKQDGIWTAIKASCILAGARTLSGALVPLVGAAPTNNGFIGIGTDYDRKTGLVGNGTSKYLNSNRADNADPQDNAHVSVYVSTADTRFATVTPMIYIGSANSGFTSRRGIGPYNSELYFGNRSSSAVSGAGALTLFMGSSRSASSGYSIRRGQVSDSRTISSVAPGSQSVLVFAGNEASSNNSWTNARLAFYSIGESLDLAKLDARVTALITAFGAAIP